MNKFSPLLLAAGLLVSGKARAVIFESTGSATFNTTAPAGDLADSGWQWQGKWRAFLGTPIAPNLFITAKHVSGTVGEKFTYTDPATGVAYAYPTIAKFNAQNRDLTIWQINPSKLFPTWAPLYTDTDEIGKDLVVFGRSAPRGAAVTVAVPGEDPLRGWKTGGTGAGTQRWGENTVAGTDYTSTAGHLLYATFDAGTGNPNEATLAANDSGGGVFIQDTDDGLWKLAGLNYGVDGPFRLTASGTSFQAAIFDAGGLYYGSPASLIVDTAEDIAGAWYASRISSNIAWIQSVIDSAGIPSGGASALNSNTSGPPVSADEDAVVDVFGPGGSAVPESSSSPALLLSALGLAGCWRRWQTRNAAPPAA